MEKKLSDDQTTELITTIKSFTSAIKTLQKLGVTDLSSPELMLEMVGEKRVVEVKEVLIDLNITIASLN